MRPLLAVALLVACTNDNSTEPSTSGKRATEVCGQPPTSPGVGDYHYWASYTTWPDNIDYALLYKSNWQSMVDYLDAEQVWRDCVVGLD